MDNKQYTFIDLFAGCGGLSEGFYQEGYKALLHLEIDKWACETLRERMRYYGYSETDISNAVLCHDITDDNILSLIEQRIGDNVDIIIGGPPCQAFSSVGRAQDPNSMNDDPRNYLFESYVKILNYYKPKLFIFENVKGLLTARPKGINIFNKIISEMSTYYDVCSNKKTILLDAANYGVPQHRERVILVGVRKDLGIASCDVYKRFVQTNGENDGLKPFLTVRDAISDLPALQPGEGDDEVAFIPTEMSDYVHTIRKPEDNKLYNHVARKHNDLDRERYRILAENDWQLKDLNKVRPDLVHHDPKHFANRYTVQAYDRPGTTVVAHLYKDGNLFIHPDPEQARTFTPREAARVQSFPDNFRFMGSRTEQYKQIGNAVPPALSSVFAKAIRTVLDEINEE